MMKNFSGSCGTQKEPYLHQLSRLTLCDETERLEAVEACWNELVGTNDNVIL